MPEFVVTYDLRETNPRPHGPFKEIAKKRSWYGASYDSSTKACKSLPNTTLSLTAPDMREAVSSFAAVVRDAVTNIANFHIEGVAITGQGEVRIFADGEQIRY